MQTELVFFARNVAGCGKNSGLVIISGLSITQFPVWARLEKNARLLTAGRSEGNLLIYQKLKDVTKFAKLQ
jgi:hypothetical protein